MPWCRALGVVLVLLARAAAADSPLTSTDLAGAYAELPAVRAARASHRASGEVLRFLVGERPTDQKAAVVNALGWQSPGNALAFLDGLAAARGISSADVKLADLTAADRFVLGYLLAMETTLQPAALRPGALDVWGATPQLLLDQAAEALPRDFAVHYVRALLEAQRAMAESGCSVWTATRRVLERFPAPRRNLRPAAVQSAQSYLKLYEADCAKAPLTAPAPGAARPLDPEHDQVYALALWRGSLVAGTQAGVVVWDPIRRRPLSSRDEKICAHVFAAADAVWAGCYGRLLRWDGGAWRSYLQDPARGDEAYAPLAGPHGELYVRYGPKVWQYDSARDTFTEALDLDGETHDALFRRNGEFWRIEFLRAVVGPQRRYERRTPAYPGSDPRALIEDAVGRLWVADFESGLLRLDDAAGTFARDPALPDKAVDVVLDPARQRRWLLHYTRGPLLEQDGRRLPTVDLADLQYMRDLALDEATGDLWVAGWTGIARVRESGGAWARDALSVRGSRRPPARKR